MSIKLTEQRDWIELLEDEDVAFLKRFLLHSGSLKDVAQSYGISYPTVRLRLNRLIAKIEVLENNRSLPRFERLVRSLHSEGRIDQTTMEALLKAQRQEQKEVG